MPPVNPVVYAEQQLDVHGIHESTKAIRDMLDGVLTELSQKRGELRVAEQQASDRKIDIVIEERVKHADMTQAAMERHLPAAFKADDQLRKFNAAAMSLKDEIDGLEMDREMYRHDISIACARMNELGGYLQYLAVAKLAQLAKAKNKEAANGSVDPWTP